MEPWLSSWSGLYHHGTVIFASKVSSSWEKGSRGVENLQVLFWSLMTRLWGWSGSAKFRLACRCQQIPTTSEYFRIHSATSMWFHFRRVQLPVDQEPCQFVWTLPVEWMAIWRCWTLLLQQLYPLVHQTWLLILLARASSIVHLWLWSGPILSCKCWMMASSSKIYCHAMS